LSYCYPTPERIREGVKALGGVIKQEMAGRKGFELKG
jgi:DNA-binding transcriptional MocR family regulator